MKSKENFLNKMIKNVDDNFLTLLRKAGIFKFAKIDANYSSGAAKLYFEGEKDENGNAVLSGKAYKFLNSYSPTAGDRVLVLTFLGFNVIFGKPDTAAVTGGTAATTAANVSVADTAGYFTSDPKNTENVLAELFTNVSDGKSLVAAAVTDKGQNASGSDSFQQLHDKIEAISGNGKQYASGTVTSSSTSETYTKYDNSTESRCYVTITNLNFIPSKIILKYNNAGSYYVTSVDTTNPYIAGSHNGNIMLTSGTSYPVYIYIDGTHACVTSGNIKLPVIAGSRVYTFEAYE